MTTTQGEPVWLELDVTDLSKARTFYGELFGWEFQDMGEQFGGYNIVTSNGDVVCGAMQITPDMGGVPDCFAIYLATDDIDAAMQRSIEAGATQLVEPMEVPGQGKMAFMADPTGAAVGLWEGEQVRVGAINRPGGVCWWELMTGDYDSAIAFYRDALGWDVHPMGDQGQEWQYSTLGQDQDAKAGICDASAFVKDGVPSFWRAYIGAADTDAAVAKVQELGGRLLDGPMDSPFGRVATVADDQGAMFQIISAV